MSGLAWDSQNQLSVTDQEKLSLYKNAADYAKAHNIALGTALTQTQVNELDKPLLWYVQQAVPDPNCNTVASTACPTVNALVPQVYLPEGYAQALTKPTGGTIAGDKVSLDIAGQLRNSGAITAADTLNVKAGSIDAGPNVVDIGTSAYKAQGGWNVITGTVAQPGGFMSAMRMHIEADSIHAVNNAFLIRNADGTVDEAATVALVNQLKANLGLNYTEGTVADDIHTRFIQEKKGGFGPIGMVVAMVAAVAISIVTAGAGAVLVTAALGSAFAATAVGVAMSVAISGLIAGTLSSMVSQLILTGSLNIGAALKAGVVSGVTAGLTQGALGALNLGNAGVTSIGDNLAKGSWDAVQSNLGNYVQASVVRSAISAGVNTVAYGGSFGQAFANGLVRDAAAVGANAIGVTLPGIGAVGADTGTILANAASHALLGCAAQSLTGGDCAGGAVGGAASALAAPLIRDAVYADSSAAKYSDDLNRLAATVGLASLIGGAAGALLGTNATSAALAAQNESLNNATSGDVKKPGPPDDIRKMLEQERRAFGQRPTVKGPGGAEVVAPSPLVLGGARANSAAGASTIQQNKAVGDAYATQTYRNVVGEMPDAVQEVTVKTASGTRTRLDIIGTNTNGAVTCVECKASATARLTPNQAAAFPEMAETGATVVGKGKPGFPGGTVIPPTTVQIVRPGDTLKKGN